MWSTAISVDAHVDAHGTRSLAVGLLRYRRMLILEHGGAGACAGRGGGCQT